MVHGQLLLVILQLQLLLVEVVEAQADEEVHDELVLHLFNE
jgi:hypothetical protein